MILRMTIWGLVPARGGSKGIPGKNLREIGGISLVGHAVRRCLAAGISNVVVASDSPEILSEGISQGATVALQRPAEISTDDSHMFLIYKWVANALLSEGNDISGLVTTLATTPFVSPKSVRLAVDQLNSGLDWVFTVNEIEHHPYRAMKVVGNRLVPYSNVTPTELWGNRQELPPLVRFNGGVIAGRVSTIVRHDEYNIHSGAGSDSVGYVEVSKLEGFDIDYPEDLEIAEILQRQHHFISWI